MWRVTDMSLTAHSLLRDRYKMRQNSLTVLILALSVCTTSLAFLHGNTPVSLIPGKPTLGVTLGVLSSTIFLLGLVDLVVNWGEREWRHDNAATRLAELKGLLRSVTISEGVVNTGGKDLARSYQDTMNAIASVPEKDFLRMKARHYRKVAVSKLIDTHQGAPVPYLRVLATIKGLAAQEMAKDDAPDTENSTDAPA
jgi:hypothetical protein